MTGEFLERDSGARGLAGQLGAEVLLLGGPCNKKGSKGLKSLSGGN